ncbi:MAG: transcriptional repressor [Bacteroidota bacterium]|nr:transcriptional repressor [Bacteroidota bacterium]
MLPEINQIFNAYLESHQQRKTPERQAILEEIYSRNDHFNAEDLYLLMKNKNYRVSKATVYNTLELLVQCDLVRKHQFTSGQALYEQSYGSKQHDHMICTKCGKLLEFCDPRIQQIKDTMGDILGFKVFHHSLTLYGNCKDPLCEKKTQVH